MLRRRFCFHTLILVALASLPLSANASPPYAKALIERARELKLAEDPYWSILMHYRPRWIKGVKSEIDHKGFFNAPNGRTHPEAELEATIESFFAERPSDPEKQQPQCLFIDRYRWLKERLSFDPKLLPEEKCTLFENWKAALDPGGVTLVFSSYYMNNPSSAFGHTLLRLNHRNRPSGAERLLDYGVNYAATPTTTNALVYGVLGMTGGFPGEFSNIPYFLKVAEYNDIENRELWEYDLNLSDAQIERMMAHLWAVGHFPSSYYFFDRNCSFMLLTLLDAANPALKLSEEFDNWWVIPADTVRGVAERPGLVKSVQVRPSLAYRVRKHFEGLSAESKKLFLKLTSASSAEARDESLRELQSQSSKSEAAAVMDASLDYLRFVKPKNKELSPELAALQTELRLRRAEIAEPSRDIRLSAEEVAERRPDTGHETSRFGLSLGQNSKSGAYTVLAWRPAFHDLNAALSGYPGGAEIEVMDLQLRYAPKPNRVRLERFSFANILSLSPRDAIFKRLSWGVRLGADPIRDFACDGCFEWKLGAGAGLAYSLGRPLLVYSLLNAELGFGAKYTPGYRFGPRADAGAILHFSDSLSLMATGSYHMSVMGYRGNYLETAAEGRVSLSRNTDLRLGYKHFPDTHQGSVTFHVYY